MRSTVKLLFGALLIAPIFAQSPCSVYEQQFRSIQDGLVQTAGTRTLPSGTTISGDFKHVTKYDLATVRKELGEPASMTPLATGGYKAIYHLAGGCDGEIAFDDNSAVRTASLAAPKLSHPAPAVEAPAPAPKESEVVKREDRSPVRHGWREYTFKAELIGAKDHTDGKLRVTPAELTFGSLRIPTTEITNVVYERTSKPRYVTGILLAWPLLFTKSKKHFLTVQHDDDFSIFRLNKSDYREVLGAVQAATGRRVERHEEQ